MGYGVGGHLGISRQLAFKTATSSFNFLPIVSESLTTNLERLVEEGIQARYDESDSHEGLLTVAGDIVFEPHPIMVGHFLRGVCGQASATAVESSFDWEFEPVQPGGDFNVNCAIPPYTIEIHRDVGSSWQFTDAIINTLAVEIAAGGIVRATAGVLARVSSLSQKATPTFPEGDPWLWDAASVSIGGAGNADFESVTITIDNKIEGFPFLDTTKLHGKYLRNAKRTVAITGNVDYASQTEYNQFRAFAAQAFVVTLKGATTAVSYNNLLSFDLPQVRYTTYPVNLGGPGRIPIAFEGMGEYDGSYAVKVTMTNTRADY